MANSHWMSSNRSVSLDSNHCSILGRGVVIVAVDLSMVGRGKEHNHRLDSCHKAISGWLVMVVIAADNTDRCRGKERICYCCCLPAGRCNTHRGCEVRWGEPRVCSLLWVSC